MKEFIYSTATVEALKPYARVFEDPNDTVLRILQDYELSEQASPQEPRESLKADVLSAAESPMRVEFDGDVSFTKVHIALIDGKSLARPKWNSIMAALCVRAIERHGLAWMSERKVPRVISGCHQTGGFHYLKESKVSVQYTDATKAWKYAAEMAKALGIALEVHFEWRDKEKAAYPGRKGIATYSPTAEKD